MKQFTYIIQDNVGIHARPAGLLAKAAKALDSVVTVEKADGKSAAATKLMWVLGQTSDPARIRELFYRPVQSDVIR